MAKMKIYEIAKSLNTKSSDLVKVLNENGFDAKSHNSNIEDSAIAFLLKNFAPKKKETATENTVMEKKDNPKVEKPKSKNSNTEEPKSQEPKSQEPKQIPEEKEKKTIIKELMDESKTMDKEQKSESALVVKEIIKTTKDEDQTEKNVNKKEDSNREEGGYQNRNNRSNDRGQGGYQNNRPSGTQGGYQNNRPSGTQGGGYQNNRPEGSQGGYQNNRPSGTQGGGYQNNRPGGTQGGGYQNNRPGGTQGGGYNNNRPGGTQGGGYNSNRPSGTQGGGYNNNRPGGTQGGGYSNNRPGGTQGGGYNNNRPGGTQGGGYNNNRPGGTQGGGYSNNRPGGTQGGGYNNNRPGGTQGGGYNNNRPGGTTQGGYNNNRPGGQGGYNNNRPGGGNQGGFNKPRTNFDKPMFETTVPLDKTAQRKNDKGKRTLLDRNKNSRYKDNDIKNIKAKKDPNRKGAFIKPVVVPVVEEPFDGIKTIEIPEIFTLRELAEKMKMPVAAVVKKLFLEGKVYSINQEISFEEAEEIALEFNFITEKEEVVDVIEELLKEDEEEETTMSKRPPVVCVMGHVDHGKTSLLDAIRKTSVTEREAGGITQHIGAYMVEASGEMITFLDTPGHEAFTSMRMRGAKSTDIAILVVAADDGVMPQTIEAISHARAAEVEIIVAINKIDKPGANIERVKQELAEHELIAEDWGGSTVFVPVSAKTGEGIDQLLEMVILTSEVLELKANANRMARGIVIEAQLDKGRGPVATILVQKGTLNVGDSIVIGSAYGKVRAMMDDKLRRVKDAKPSTPVEILGLNEVPDAGEIFMVTENDKEARSIAEAYIKKGREKLLFDTKAKLSLDGLFSQIQAGNVKELNLIVKADVQGSVEAVKQSLVKLTNEEVAIRIVHGGVGAINESDVNLASTSNAIIIGFNVRPDPTAKESAEREKVDLRLYKVIYKAIEDIEAAMKGMLDPVFEEKVIGHAVIRQVFKASKVGNIAGSYVLDGKIIRDSKVRISREGEQIFEGNLASLKRFKDDVKEVANNYECGLVFEDFDSVQEDDVVEIYVMEEVPR